MNTFSLTPRTRKGVIEIDGLEKHEYATPRITSCPYLYITHKYALVCGKDHGAKRTRLCFDQEASSFLLVCPPPTVLSPVVMRSCRQRSTSTRARRTPGVRPTLTLRGRAPITCRALSEHRSGERLRRWRAHFCIAGGRRSSGAWLEHGDKHSARGVDRTPHSTVRHPQKGKTREKEQG